MAANVGLVARAAQRNAHVLTPHRPRDRLRDRGLTDARGPNEQQDRPLGALVVLVAGGVGLGLALPQLPHRQELEDLVLHVLQSVVILFEDLGGPLQIERLLRALAPGKFRHRLEIRADDLSLHRLAAGPFQAAQLAIDLLAGGLGQVQSGEPLVQLLDLSPVVALTQLFLNRLHLLAQQHLALALAQLLLDLGLDVVLRVRDGDLSLDVHEHPAQPVFDRQHLEELLAFERLDVEVAGDEVRQLPGLGDSLENLFHHILGKAGFLAQLRGTLARLAVQGDEGRIVGVQGRQV